MAQRRPLLRSLSSMRRAAVLALAVVAVLPGGVRPWGIGRAPIATSLRPGTAVDATTAVPRWRLSLYGRPALRPASRMATPLRMAGTGTTRQDGTYDRSPGAALMARLGAIDDGAERRAALRENFQACDNDAMEFLGAKLQAGETGNWPALLGDLQDLMQERLEAGKELLSSLIASGEINVLDRKIVEKVKSGECDPSFLNVLQINLQDAEQNMSNEEQGGSQRFQVLLHIYTRVQEELEKKAKPAVGLLHKLLRMIDEPGIRVNVLEHNLKPKPEEERAMVVVDGKMTLEPGSLVDPMDLVSAITDYMNRIRGLDQVENSGFTEADIAQSFEDCRVIAKEARLQVEAHYSKEILDDFTESLTPVFEPIMGTLENYRRS